MATPQRNFAVVRDKHLPMKVFTGIVALLLLMGCKKGDLKLPAGKACATIAQQQILSVSGPTTASLQIPVTFGVSWQGANGCDAFVKFIADTTGNTINIKTYTSHDSCSVCTTTDTYKISSYKFTPAKAGTWYLKFYHLGKDTTSAITDTLVVK